MNSTVRLSFKIFFTEKSTCGFYEQCMDPHKKCKRALTPKKKKKIYFDSLRPKPIIILFNTIL